MGEKVVIIGAGPSGSYAALKLKNMGYDVVLIDKNIFPRHKLCGGLLSQTAVKYINNLNIDLDRFSNTVDMVYINYNDKKCKIQLENKITLVDRKILDYEILQVYTKNNGLFREHEIALNIDEKNKVLYTDKRKYNYDMLIIANGSSNYFRKQLNMLKLTIEPAIECINKKNNSASDNVDVSIFFHDSLKGFGWIFEHKEDIYRGIGGICKEKKIKDLFTDFFGKQYQMQYAPIHFGKPVQYRKNNIYFIGDSGGFVNPLTGEGLSYSFLSADAVVEAIRFNRTCIFEAIQKNLYFYYKIRQIFYSPFFGKFLKRSIFKHTELSKKIIESVIINGDINTHKICDVVKLFK